MIKIKELTVKNFMSVGNQTQAVNFAQENLTLVLGENLDQGGDDSGSRNGTGKTTIVNALSFALFGNALTNIKNNPNGKNNSQYNNDYVQIINNYNEIVSTRQSLDAKLAELYEIGDTKSNFYQKKLISTSYTKIILTVLATALVVTAFIVAKNKA